MTAGSRPGSGESERNTGRTREEEASVPVELYHSDAYLGEEQFASFRHQIQLIKGLGAEKILEVGVGNSLVSMFLRRIGLAVTTVDCNAALKPDVVASVTKLADLFDEGEFDAVLCAEVLEHLPFDEFDGVLGGIEHVSSRYAVLTLPRAQRVVFDMACRLKLPRTRHFGFHISAFGKQGVRPEHHWEIGATRNTSLRSVQSIVERRFLVSSSGRVPGNPYHWFFVLRKRGS